MLNLKKMGLFFCAILSAGAVVRVEVPSFRTKVPIIYNKNYNILDVGACCFPNQAPLGTERANRACHASRQIICLANSMPILSRTTLTYISHNVVGIVPANKGL